jgi:two-component system, OmpR family, response regulator ChvI
MDTTYFSKAGASNIFDDKKPVSNIACGNKTSTSTFDKLIPDPLNLSAFQSEQNDTDRIPLTNSEKLCVSVIDIVGSTSIVSTIGNSKDIRKFYEIFLNTIAILLMKYRAKIIKTVGDGIISYFPDTTDTTNVRPFENVLECCFAQIEQRFAINEMLVSRRLPTIRYRVSADFGKVERARFGGSDSEDLFGPTVNVCSKINLFAPPNAIVVGNDLYRIIRSFKQLDYAYKFDEMDSYYCGSGKFSYPLYSLSMKQRITPVNPLNSSLSEIKMHAIKGIKSSRIPKILLIDDELDDLFVLEKLLVHGGFEVKSFSSPREALRHYANGDPSSYDLVISDIRMPEMNGFQMYHKLKAINDDVNVLFATCLEIAEEIFTLIPDLQPHQLIQKPVEKEKFIEMVKKNIR